MQARPLLDHVPRAASLAHLRKVVLLGELFHMQLDRVAVGPLESSISLTVISFFCSATIASALRLPK